MKNKRIILIVIVAFFVFAAIVFCSTSHFAVQPTSTFVPTWTLRPTFTPQSTYTPVPSQTAGPVLSTQAQATVQSWDAPCHSIGGKPDPVCTPGAVNPSVTQANIYETICVVGYTATIRPPSSYTNKLKAQQIKDYGYVDTNLSDYEEDHLIPLELGGDPTNPKNLWPEPYSVPGNYGAYSKDKVENLLHKEVCNGQIGLAQAQLEISSNWETLFLGAGFYTSPVPQVTALATAANPNGPTALCKDGTYSYASSHQGACSKHGGVAQFYK